MTFTAPLDRRIADIATAEAVRVNHERRIAELAAELVTLNGAPGRLIGRRFLVGSGQYVPTPGTRWIIVRMVGGGGGGGGTTGGGTGTANGSGGGSGAYLEFDVVAVSAVRNGLFSCGAGGAGGSTSGGNGGTGGDTTFTINGVTYTAKGGTGGTGQVNTTAAHAPTPGRRQGGGSAVQIVVGEDGERGVYAPSDGYFWGGAGGSNPLGTGGGTVNGDNVGLPGSGFGGGGGGASATTTARAGGLGAIGGILLLEFS